MANVLDLLATQLNPIGFDPSSFPSERGILEMLARRGNFGNAQPRAIGPAMEAPMIPGGLPQGQQVPQPQAQQGGGGFKGFMKEALSNFLYALGEGMAAGGGAEGFGVALMAPEKRRQMTMLQQREEEKLALDERRVAAEEALRQVQLMTLLQPTEKDRYLNLGQAGVFDKSTGKFISPPTVDRPDTSLTPFEAWRKQNPDAPVEQWFELQQKVSQPTVIPGRDVPFSPEVEAQKARISEAGRAPGQLIPGRDTPLSPGVEEQRIRMALATQRPAANSREVTTAKQKLITLTTAKQQLAEVKTAFDKIKGTFSAGLLQGETPTPSGQAYDAAVDAMRDIITSLTRTPGIGAMSDFETRLTQAKLPDRGLFKYESTIQEQIRLLETLLNGIESGYEGLLEGQPASAPKEPSEFDFIPGQGLIPKK